MNILDIGIILLLIMFFIVGFKNGVIRELVSLVGIIVILIVSYILKGIIGSFLCTHLPFFSFAGPLKGLTALNIFIYQAIAFLIIFTILLSVYEIVLVLSKVIQKVVNLTIILILPSKILGGFVSMIKGWIILLVVLIVITVPFHNQSMIEESVITNRIIKNTPILSRMMNKFTTTTEEIYELVEAVDHKEIGLQEANKQTINIMLKYNVVDKATIEDLIQSKKLEDIENIQMILNKY